jgi:hypothetical protein
VNKSNPPAGEGLSRPLWGLMSKRNLAMSKNRSWQAEGLRLGGQLIDEQDAHLLVAELQEQIKDAQLSGEIDDFLNRDRPLSQGARTALQLVLTGLLMRRP